MRKKILTTLFLGLLLAGAFFGYRYFLEEQNSVDFIELKGLSTTLVPGKSTVVKNEAEFLSLWQERLRGSSAEPFLNLDDVYAVFSTSSGYAAWEIPERVDFSKYFLLQQTIGSWGCSMEYTPSLKALNNTLIFTLDAVAIGTCEIGRQVNVWVAVPKEYVDYKIEFESTLKERR